MSQRSRRGGCRISMPTAGRCCGRAGVSSPHSAITLRSAISSRSKRQSSSARRAMKPISTPLRPNWWRRGARSRLYLHTSPEFACKKLLAAGERRIFEFSRVFRNRERGALHHPEFTMLEWYRVGEPHTAVMDDCLSFLRIAAATTGTKSFAFRGRAADPFAEPERLTVTEAFARHAGIDLWRRSTGRLRSRRPSRRRPRRRHQAWP